MRRRGKDEAWYEADRGLIIRRYRSDEEAAGEIAEALDRGWEILSHNVIWRPSMIILVPFLGFFSDRTEHVITFAKPA